MADQQTVEFIRSSQAQGISKEDIYKDLLGRGMTIESIQQSFDAITSEHDQEDTHKRTILIVLYIGVLLIGAGIFSFIASNWQYMDKVMKVFVIVAAMLGSYAAGWYVQENTAYRKTGMALMVLGSVIYGAGIFLVGQMFNIRANWPDGFILWFLGSLLMAYAVGSFALVYISIGLAIISLFGYPSVLFSSRSMAGNPYLHTSTLLLVVTTAATLLAGWLFARRLPDEQKEVY